jgi:N-glycosidase YbiA
MLEPVLFYTTKGDYGCFSNFSHHSVSIVDMRWKTSEHAYQALKFYPHKRDVMQLIQDASSPRAAADLGRSYKPINPKWEDRLHADRNPLFEVMVDDSRGKALALERHKDLAMYRVLLAKFKQNKGAREVLVRTENRPLIEDSPIDSYWGWGPRKDGVNRLGKILMLVRLELRRYPAN